MEKTNPSADEPRFGMEAGSLAGHSRPLFSRKPAGRCGTGSNCPAQRIVLVLVLVLVIESLGSRDAFEDEHEHEHEDEARSGDLCQLLENAQLPIELTRSVQWFRGSYRACR